MPLIPSTVRLRSIILQSSALLLSTVLHNTYSATVHLFVTGEGEISSTEDTTQGDPLAMAMYALAVVPLIGQLSARVPEACQAWFADDATAVGPLSSLFQWWRHLAIFCWTRFWLLSQCL